MKGKKKRYLIFHSCDTAEAVTRSQSNFYSSIIKVAGIQCSLSVIIVIGIAVCFKMVEYSSRRYQILIFFLTVELGLDVWYMSCLMWVERKTA